ncbi:hypothetical protein [Dyadobacter sp. NIV53]|uniref:hypothetical protein n=1 Tax=Dyadobacter sp. NIV53 TaxID=2861765 RepID=UPI001C87E0D5|nr:hypothetical protein [Dyadobacter sp. NIV53]
MKTSTKLIAILLAFSLFAMIGSDMSIKAKFDKIDKNDPYYGYLKEPVKPFKYVKMTGNFFGYTQIEPGKEFEIRLTDFYNYTIKPKINWKINADTLHVHYEMQGEKYPYNDKIYWGAPQIFIIAPQLSGVQSIGLSSSIKGWKNGTMSVEQSGNGVIFSDNHFDELSIDLKSGGNLDFWTKNVIGNVNITVKDSSKLTVEKDVFNSFNLKVDSTAHISLPGSLFRKFSAL